MSRITFSMINTMVMRQLSANQSRLAELQEQMSSGKALNRPSDDPIAVVNDLDLRSEIDHRTQNKRNTNNGSSYLTIVDSTLMGADSLVQQIREKALQGSNDTLLPNDRSYINNEVHEVLLQLVNVGNSSYKGDYLFSGTNTDEPAYSVLTGSATLNDVANEIPVGGAVPDSSDEAVVIGTPVQLYDRSMKDSKSTVSEYGNPEVCRIIPGTFEITNGSLEEGTDYTIDYVNGTITFLTANAATMASSGIDMSWDWIRRNELDNANNDIYREIESGITMPINSKADDVFGAENEMDLFSSTIALMQGLHTSQQQEIETSITYIDDSLQRLLGEQSSVGARYNRLEATSDRNDTNIIEATSLQSELEDVDLAESISDFLLAKNIYDASLQSAIQALTPSLMDYM